MSSECQDFKFRNFILRLSLDENPQNPRSWDNLGTMVCWHRRQHLGDTTLGEAGGRKVEGEPFFEELSDIEALIKSGQVLSLPLYFYDHSIQSISTQPFHNAWDSGPVGYIYVDKKDVRKEFGVKRVSPAICAKVMQDFEAEVEIYNKYLQGDVWGYEIYGPIPQNFVLGKDDPLEYPEGESVWGFFGKDECLREAKINVDVAATPHDNQVILADFVQKIQGSPLVELENQQPGLILGLAKLALKVECDRLHDSLKQYPAFDFFKKRLAELQALLDNQSELQLDLGLLLKNGG